MATAGPLLIAHRTCPRQAPENSFEGVRAAAELGADLVELDVRRTRDGVPVLLHDPLLRRTTDHWWPVRLVSARRLRQVRLRGNAEPVPELGAVLDALPPGLGVAIDIKDAGAADAVLAEVRRRRVADRVLMWSQHGRAVRALARAAPDLEVGLLRDTATARAHARLLDDAVRWGAGGISVHQDAATPDLIQQAAERGLRTYTWFQDLASMRTTPWTGLAGVVTDWVPEARQLRAERA
jgi:glycerophosphoryl diester phosphodiesterase